jgi:hypothetical protein
MKADFEAAPKLRRNLMALSAWKRPSRNRLSCALSSKAKGEANQRYGTSVAGSLLLGKSAWGTHRCALFQSFLRSMGSFITSRSTGMPPTK